MWTSSFLCVHVKTLHSLWSKPRLKTRTLFSSKHNPCVKQAVSADNDSVMRTPVSILTFWGEAPSFFWEFTVDFLQSYWAVAKSYHCQFLSFHLSVWFHHCAAFCSWVWNKPMQNNVKSFYSNTKAWKAIKKHSVPLQICLLLNMTANFWKDM